MATTTTPRVRMSITELQDEYGKGNTKPLDDLMAAWAGIKALPPVNPDGTANAKSFFVLGGYHGEPFRGAGWGNSAWWGGFCNHGNVLFPVWHRAYLLKLEEALQSIEGCEDVMLPYWDETSTDSVANGIPWALAQPTYTVGGPNNPNKYVIPNPLYSFVFNKAIFDNISSDNPNYSKPLGYETVRYPLSGLVGTPADQAATEKHNAQFPDPEANIVTLNENITTWLNTNVTINGVTISNNVYGLYKSCLDAPNYTVFSNVTSAQQWNEDIGNPNGNNPNAWTAVPLEEPHDSIHLAVGGFQIPTFDADIIPGANGDMGENDTAGLDPIFFFHHCNVDRMFWAWQKKHDAELGSMDRLDIIEYYPGTNSVDSQGPTPGVSGNVWLNMDSLLTPFQKPDGTTYTGNDCINIEKSMGYTYSIGSLDAPAPTVEALAAMPADSDTLASHRLHVSGINRAAIAGSFLISAHAIIDGKKYHVGTKAVLSRWHVQGCANCMTHQETKAVFPLHGLSQETLDKAHIQVELHTRRGQSQVFTQQGMAPQTTALTAATQSAPTLKFEIR